MSVKCQFRAVVLRRKGAVAYGVQQGVQTKRGLFAQADKAYRDAIGGDEWPDWAEQGGEDDGEPYHTGGA